MLFAFGRALGAVGIVVRNFGHREPHSRSKTIRRNGWRLPAFLNAPSPVELRSSADSAALRGAVPPRHLPACPVQLARILFSTQPTRFYFRWESSAEPDRSFARPADNFPGGTEFRP